MVSWRIDGRLCLGRRRWELVRRCGVLSLGRMMTAREVQTVFGSVLETFWRSDEEATMIVLSNASLYVEENKEDFVG